MILDRPVKDIKFDLDGVLVNLIAVTEGLLNADGIYIEPGRTGFKVTTLPEISNNKLWKYFKQAYTFWRVTPIFDGARELTKEVYHRTGRPVSIITARPLNYASETYQQIDLILDVPFNVAITQGPTKQAHLDPDDIIVEDRRQTVVELAEIGIRSLLVDKIYNQIDNPPSQITRVSGLPEIITMLPDLFER